MVSSLVRRLIPSHLAYPSFVGSVKDVMMSDHTPTTLPNSETGTAVRTVTFSEQIEFPIFSDSTLRRVFFKVASREIPLELGAKLEITLVGWEESNVIGNVI